jgi:hypothetical protein
MSCGVVQARNQGSAAKRSDWFSSRKENMVSKTIKIVGLTIGVITFASIAVCFVAVSRAPDVSVYVGRQVPKRFMTTIRSLHLLEEDEQITYFYSDAFFDIKAGLYFVTDNKLVLYSSDWEEPEIIVSLDQIASLDAVYDNSFLTDTAVHVTTDSGVAYSFPLSSDKGLDKKFVEAVKKKMNVEEETPPATGEPSP